VLKAEPVIRALEAQEPTATPRRVVMMSPKGRTLTQDWLETQAQGCDLTLVCGRYKAVDERVRAHIDEEISLGDYVISGGELAAMVIIDGIVRLIPGVLSDLDSALGDSFTCGLLDSAYYTRPETLRGESVPKVLLSGNHEEIRKWRRRDALLQTLKRRPDLLKRSELDRDDVRFLAGHGWSGKTDH
jgi:tRNA (guanine37-N1)-methyltransferase